MKLHNSGVIYENGALRDAAATADGAKKTIAYSILQKHNTSGDESKLKIKFDKITSHDITYVGIIQTARASGLEKFPIPYVLTNCHNSLCAVGGTINDDVSWNALTKWSELAFDAEYGECGIYFKSSVKNLLP